MDESKDDTQIATQVTALSQMSTARLPHVMKYQADTFLTNPNVFSTARSLSVTTDDEKDDDRPVGANLKEKQFIVASASTINIDSGHSRTLSNNFSIEEINDTDSSISKNFDFGIYLEYWRRGRKNSVIPKYETLRDELTKNTHATITEDQYDELVRKCKVFLNVGFKANDIGRSNEICKIPPGSPITLEHLIALKLYTDFDKVQREFKRHFRRLRGGETLESVMKRNQEIAHWSRLLRESVMFWGKTMAKKEEFYCGLTARLVLRSLNQRFECPLSTTKEFGMMSCIVVQFLNYPISLESYSRNRRRSAVYRGVSWSDFENKEGKYTDSVFQRGSYQCT